MIDSDMVKNIQSREEFINFVRQLGADYKHTPEDWENSSIDRYLEAVAAWVADMNGYYRLQETSAPELNWSSMAQILLAGKSYE